MALACMYAVGGAQGLVILARPHWPIASPGLVLGVAAAAFAAAPAIWLLRRRFGDRLRQVGLALGTVATSVAVYACGAQPSSMSAAYSYFLVVLYAAAYFRPLAAAVHTLLAAELYAVALGLHPASVTVVQWLQAVAELVVIALIVGSFAAHARGSAAQIVEQGFHDRLTGLANRALFMDRMDHALARDDADHEPIGVLVMDLDDFKEVNDSLGHPAGDQLISLAAQRLASLVGAGDTLARIGGDEFGVLMAVGPMPRAAEELAAQIVGAFGAEFEVSDERLHVGVSVGLAIGQPGVDAANELLRDADLAMYQAKREGKGRYERARAGMRDETLEHLTLVADLWRALDHEQFEVYYQPIVAVGTRRPVGAEALVRWHHPTRGLVTPDRFIAAAETAGLIVPLGEWVLRAACRQARRWVEGGAAADSTFYVSVNVSPRQLADPDFVDKVRSALRESGLASEALVLEITESTLMLDFDEGLARLLELKALGLRIALDDYGTGFSSMNRLRRLPVDIIKIDKSFVDDVVEHVDGAALVRSIIDVAGALRMISIAEGVETADQCLLLGRLGCDAVQGNLIATPAPAADAGRVLRRLAGDSTGSRSISHRTGAARAVGGAR